MGAGIAAQVANSATNVLLLDIAIDKTVKEKMLASKMPQIAHPTMLGFMEIGNIDESLEKINSCDLIIEVIVEKQDVKGDLYKKIAPFIKPGAILASNTSTLPMHELRKYLPASLQHNFLLTHFFNPPRYMQLLEIIYDEHTSKEAVERVSSFITRKLGKIIVKSNDTPGFIANRIGCFLMELTLTNSYEKKIPIPIVDYAFSNYLGFPTTGIFGLFDLIGLDVMQMIATVLQNSLPSNDPFNLAYKKYPFYNNMVQSGYKGRKGLGGFYKLNGKLKEALDWKEMSYMDASTVELPKEKSLGEFLKHNKYGKDIESIINEFFTYTDSLLGVVSNSKDDIDTAMKLGYSWKYGPFELKEILSGKQLKVKEQITIKSLLENPSAMLYEAKPKNLVFSFKTKMNTFDRNVFNLLIESVDYAEKHHAEKLIIYTEGKHFSAGADLRIFLDIANRNDITAANEFISLGQRAMSRVQHSKVPVVACAQGVALGGGCELLLHSHAVVAHLDLCAGLVEIGIGGIPAWGGLKEMVLRSSGDSDQLISNLKNIMFQNKSSSAYFFFDDYSIANGHVVMNKNQLLDYALSHDFPARSTEYNDLKANIDLVGSLKDKPLDEYTIFIAKTLQEEINSDNLSEGKLLEIEKNIFSNLLMRSETRDKMGRVVI